MKMIVSWPTIWADIIDCADQQEKTCNFHKQCLHCSVTATAADIEPKAVE